MAEYSDYKYWPVNWVDGMLLNKKLLTHQDFYNSERIADAIKKGLTPFNYGIIKRSDSDENCIVNVSVESRTFLKINIIKCQAITSGGIRISIPGIDWELEEISIELDNISGYSEDASKGDFYVVLTVNPSRALEFGAPDPDEEPQRYPYYRPYYTISVIQANSLDRSGPGTHALPIALLSIKNGELKQVEDYVPPCTMLQSHCKLIDFTEQLQLHLRSLENSATSIVQKVRSKHQENTLALGINSLAIALLDTCSKLLTFLNLQAKWLPVIEVIEQASCAARHLKNTLDTWQGNGKEEILTYLAEWCDLNQGEFEKNLNELICINYKHHNIIPSIELCQKLFISLAPVFSVLAELDYIGKKIDTDLFVKEEVIKFEEETIKSKKGGLFRK